MKSLRQVWAAAQGNPRNPKIAKRFKRSMNQETKRPLIPLTLLQTAAKRRWESEGESPSGGFGRQPKVTPTLKKNVVSEQNAKHSAIETGLRRKAWLSTCHSL